MADSTRKKSIYLFGLAVSEMHRQWGVLYFGTLTFSENVEDKAEAMKRWHRLRDRLRRLNPDFLFSGVWQRQKRGAWHLHFFTPVRLSVDWLRTAAVACGFGCQLRMEVVGNSDAGSRCQTLKRAVRYAVRYAVRDVESGEYFGEALFTYGAGARRGTVRFQWARGLSYLWRLGVDEWISMDTGESIRSVPYLVLVRVGWESLTLDRQMSLCAREASVWKWAIGPPGEGNSVMPF